MEIEPLHEDELLLINAVLEDADNAMAVDCASQRVDYTVAGWFLFPKGSLVSVRIDLAS